MFCPKTRGVWGQRPQETQGNTPKKETTPRHRPRKHRGFGGNAPKNTPAGYTYPMRLDGYLAQFPRARPIALVGPRPLTEPIPAAPPVIWVDGGVRHRPAGQNFGFAVGDGDSSDQPLDEYLPRAKAYSDFAYALQCVPKHCAELILLGLLGGRRDHELFNLGAAHDFLTRAAGRPCRARFDRAVYGYSRGEWRFEMRGEFSLAALAPATVQLRGACAYKLEQPVELPPLTSRGLSNRGCGEIILTAQSPVFILTEPPAQPHS